MSFSYVQPEVQTEHPVPETKIGKFVIVLWYRISQRSLLIRNKQTDFIGYNSRVNYNRNGSLFLCQTLAPCFGPLPPL